MKYLAIKTDQPKAYIGYFDGKTVINERSWLADRELSDTILVVIDGLINHAPESMEGVVVFEGPGSFTGLRIGISVANSLAYGLDIPVVVSSGEDWLKSGFKRLQKGDDDKIATAKYGGEANITKPKK